MLSGCLQIFFFHINLSDKTVLIQNRFYKFLALSGSKLFTPVEQNMACIVYISGDKNISIHVLL